jgi:hypothetical protein
VTSPDQCHLADITLCPSETRDAIMLLIDVYAILDHLIGKGHTPGLADQAEDYLKISGSHYTALELLAGLNALSYRLTNAMHDAVTRADTLHDHTHSGALQTTIEHQTEPNQSATSPSRTDPDGAKSKEHTGATSG